MATLDSLPLIERIVLDTALKALPPNLLTISDGDTGLGLRISPDAAHTFNVAGLSDRGGGIGGHFFISGLDAAPLQADLFSGFTVALTAFDFTLADGGLIASHIGGKLTIPYFTDAGLPKTVDVEFGVKADGSLSVTLAAQQSDPGSMTPDGLVKLEYNIGAGTTVELELASLEMDKSAGSVFQIVIGGRLAIASAGLNWPSFDFKALRIDSNGRVSLDGGWIDLPDHTALDFYGFHVALEKLGFGSGNDGRWIGFGGQVHLIEGISLGGSVRGLKINLDTGKVSFDGVGVSFEIPGVLEFSGDIDHLHAANSTDLVNAGLPPSLPVPTDVFAGDVHVVVTAAGGLEVDATFIVGHFGGVSVFFLALDAELPVGIPIFLDISLWGVHGFFASNLRPDPSPHTWWDWYKFPDAAGTPNLAGSPDYTATEYHKWLKPHSGAFSLGAGVTIGTSADDGFTASAAVTFVLMLPGPVISLIGQANVLSKRVSGANADANFQAMATFDGGAGTFDLVIQAHLSFLSVIDIEGTAEVYVNSGKDKASRGWYFALGLPPHDKRIRARIFDLFETDSYFVISDHGLITGSYIGFNKSWDFGPLGVSVNAYIATLIAMQWSPIQIGGGMEFHGEVHLEAFGTGLGLTADALLEGCAPNPFWVHGEFSVELDLPWPLPDLGATVSLSWGGDDGTVPPAPLALSRVDALLLDHMAASDRYTLLAHHPAPAPLPDPRGRPQSDNIVVYDAKTPGILGLTPPNETAWHGRVDGQNPLLILPDADPSLKLPFAPVVPQDAHFTLSFAHPTNDAAGFANSASSSQIQPDVTEVAVPTPQLPADDMSNLNPNPPKVQWAYRHTLRQVALYQYSAGVWTLIASQPPEPGPPNMGLAGAWLPPESPPDNAPDQLLPNSMLKVAPFIMLPGDQSSAFWQGSGQTPGMHFSDQGLKFDLDAGLAAAQLTGEGLAVLGGAAPDTVTITSPVAAEMAVGFQVLSIVSVMTARQDEFSTTSAPVWRGDGVPLAFASVTLDGATGLYTQSTGPNPPVIQKLTVTVPVSSTLTIRSLLWKLPDIRAGILPTAPALYALKAVTKIEAGRVGDAPQPPYQTVTDGDPIVEFAYFQTACGPGTAVADEPPPPAMPGPGVPPAPPAPPRPAVPPAYPALASTASVPATVGNPYALFPRGGQLLDLQTYLQWSWPPDGDRAAYYGYDVNVEFNETYVNKLYATLSGGDLRNSLHFRCFDRNQIHVALRNNGIRVPSMYWNSALVAHSFAPPLPQTVLSLLPPDQVFAARGLQRLVNALLPLAADASPGPGRVDLSPGPLRLAASEALPPTPADLGVLKEIVGRSNVVVAPGSLEKGLGLNPATAAAILHLIRERAAAAQLRDLWPRALQPGTRYTLDVVAGPFDRGLALRAVLDSFNGVYSAKDAIGALQALKDYYLFEDSLSTLARIEFATSRYATFRSQMAHAVAQSASAATRIRRYRAAADPQTWLSNPANHDDHRATAQTAYTSARSALAAFFSTFQPMADDLPPGLPRLGARDQSQAGESGLIAQRRATQSAWEAFAGATAASFDGLIAALGRSDLTSAQHTAPPPDTELSFFVDQANGVVALLLESPEPLAWRRLWQWTHLAPQILSSQLKGLAILWSGDGTRALLVPLGRAVGTYVLTMQFQGNIGPEAASITSDGGAVNEVVAFSPLHFRTFLRL